VSHPAAGWRCLAYIAAATGPLLACGDESAQRAPGEYSDAEKVGGLAVVCYMTDFDSLNPLVSPDQGAADLRLLLFTPLVLYGEAGEYRPLLANDWAWEADQRVLVLRIRQDLTWHDGTPVTAEDVAWTLRIAADPEYSYLSDDFTALRDVAVVDSATLEVRFAEPFIAGLEAFVGLPILPRHLLADLPIVDFATAEYHRAPVGSGPFRFANRRSDGSIILERASGYPEDLGRPFLDRLVLRTIREKASLVVEVETSGVDLCVTTSSVADAVERSRVEVTPIEPAATQVVPLNTRIAPLDDARVRRALSAALRRSEIAATISSIARPARNPLPESSPWYDSDLLQADDDSALAVSLLEDAGWPLTGDVRRNAQGQELRFTLLAPQVTEVPMVMVQAQLRRVGVQVDLRFMEWTSYVGLLQSPDDRPAAMALGFVPSRVFNVESDLYSTFHTGEYSNLGFYSVPEVDALLERLMTALPTEERAAIYDELQRRVAEDVPIIYTINEPRLLIRGPRLQGVAVDLNGPFASVTKWWISPTPRRIGG
jgi:peptide/nickel transport system substrate-binding protein